MGQKEQARASACGQGEKANAVQHLQTVLKSAIRVAKPVTVLSAMLLCAPFSHASAAQKASGTDAYSISKITLRQPDFMKERDSDKPIKTHNMAGYVAFSNTPSPQPVVSEVVGTWKVPLVWTQCGWENTYHPARYSYAWSSQWIGIGGQLPGDNTLIQIGTEANFYSKHGYYSIFYQVSGDCNTDKTCAPMKAGTDAASHKKSMNVENFNVMPGDIVHAEIKLIGQMGNRWMLKIVDSTQNEEFSTTVTYKSKRLSAEWMVERPIGSLFGQLTMGPLPGFNAVQFLDLSASNSNYATIGAESAGISYFKHERDTLWEIEDGTSVAHESASPTKLDSEGRGFHVYKLDCTTDD